MKDCVRLITATLCALTIGCTTQEKTADDMGASVFRDPPTTVSIDVKMQFDEENDRYCVEGTQTVEVSCPGAVTNDPKNIACQRQSSNTSDTARRRISWNGDGKRDFRIVFEDGETPFSNLGGRHCDLGTAAGSFTCKLRKPKDDPPLKYSYKYNVVVDDDNACNLDPHVFIMR